MLQELRINEEKIILNNSLMVIFLHDRPSIFVRMNSVGPQDPGDHLTQVINDSVLVGPHRIPYSLNTGSSLTVSPFHRETISQRTREIIHAFKCFAIRLQMTFLLLHSRTFRGLIGETRKKKRKQIEPKKKPKKLNKKKTTRPRRRPM